MKGPTPISLTSVYTHAIRVSHSTDQYLGLLEDLVPPGDVFEGDPALGVHLDPKVHVAPQVDARKILEAAI